jgi:NADH:ubiquinone oxidoreductase subunit D
MDFPDTTIPRIRAFIEQMKHSLGEYDRLITHNVIIQARSKDIGVLSPEKALAYGCTGPVLRGSGVRFDLRKNRPYSIYDRFEFDIPIGRTGDCYDRYLVRMEEIRQSLRILEQAIAAFPAGPHRAKELANIKLPAGTYYSEVETAKGIFGTAIVADGTLKPYRIHNRSPNFCNVTVLDELCRGHKIADIVAVLATIDVVIPDIDR